MVNRNFGAKTVILIAAIAVIAAAAVWSVSQAGLGNSKSQGKVPISLTDPPRVPSGTTALTISYSGVQVHYVGNNGTSGWMSAQGNGTLDLMSLINVSQTIAMLNATLAANTVVDKIRFNITSANITINGTTSKVFVPQGQVVANVSKTAINGSSEFLLDLSPTVVVIYTNSSAIFVFVPSLRAVVVPRSGSGIGMRTYLSQHEKTDLGMEAPSISITNVSLSSYANTMSLSVTVKNDGNKTADLTHVFLYGRQAIIYMKPLEGTHAPEKSRQGRGFDALGDGTGTNVSAQVSSAVKGLGLNATDHADGNVGIGNGDYHAYQVNLSSNSSGLAKIAPIFRTLNFMVEPNGSLQLPFVNPCSNDTCIESEAGAVNGSGYMLGSGQSVTLLFSGNVIYGGSSMEGAVLPGNYVVDVVGEQGAWAGANVTDA